MCLSEELLSICKVGTKMFPVISIDNLIKMKKITGRLKDKLDITELKKIKKLKKRK